MSFIFLPSWVAELACDPSFYLFGPVFNILELFVVGIILSLYLMDPILDNLGPVALDVAAKSFLAAEKSFFIALLSLIFFILILPELL